jgi:hypothetical protein
MKTKKYIQLFILIFTLFIIQTIYIEYSFSNHKQQLVDLQLNLEESLYNVNNQIQYLEKDILTASQKSFVNSHKIPNVIYFCGEKINLDDPFIRESVEREFYALLNKQGQIQLYLKRIGRYSKMIESHIKNQKLPLDLKYLSIHESALLPTIRSSSRAVGLWQFMASTAQHYGLQVDRYIDERRDPEKSTPAALKYLNDLHDQFGNWPLALAAYNGGPNRVRKSIQRQNAQDFYDLTLPEETERYYFKIIATKIILSNPEEYGFKMNENDFYAPHPTQKVEFTIYESRKYLDEIADICDLNLATFKALNPSLKADYLPAGKYKINTYSNLVAVFNQNFYQYSNSLGMIAKAGSEEDKNSKID